MHVIYLTVYDVPNLYYNVYFMPLVIGNSITHTYFQLNLNLSTLIIFYILISLNTLVGFLQM